MDIETETEAEIFVRGWDHGYFNYGPLHPLAMEIFQRGHHAGRAEKRWEEANSVPPIPEEEVEEWWDDEDDFDYTSIDYPDYDPQFDHFERFGRPAFPNEY